MKKIFPLLIGLWVISCTNSTEKSDQNVVSVTPKKEVYKYYQITLEHDTINVVDFNDKKQGLWITFKPLNITEPITKLEEGYYKDDKKIGYWKYYKDGVLSDSVLMK